MKVLHVTPWYEPAWSSGGTAVSASNMCRALVRLEAEVCVLTTTDMGAGQVLSKQSYVDELGGVEVHYAACGLAGTSFRQGAFSFTLCKNIVSKVAAFDIVHIHSTRHVYGAVTALACRRANIPYIVTAHGSLMPWWIEGIGRPFIKKLYINMIDRYVLAGAKSLHFLSDFERESSTQWSFNKVSFVLPNGIKKQKSAFVNKSNEQRIKLLHVGRIHPQKNTLELIKAACQFSSESIILDIIGAVDDEPFYTACRDYIANNNIRHVRLLGAKSFEEVQKAYTNYDLFCMPSVVEGVSMALIEAASFGLPALVSEFVGNYREILADGSGVLVGVDAESISLGIASLVKDKEKLDALKLNALNSVNKRYDIDRVAALLMQKYKDIVAN